MISEKMKAYIHNEFSPGLDFNFEIFKYTEDKQLIIAIKQVYPSKNDVNKNIHNVIEYLVENETDIDKQAVLLGFKNNAHREEFMKEFKKKWEILMKKEKSKNES